MGFSVRERGGGFSLKIDASDVGKRLKKFPERYADEARRAFVRGGVEWERKMKRRFTGYRGESGDRLQNRTGQLRRTIHYRVVGGSLKKLTLLMIVGDARTPYAMAQEFGAVITPRNAGALTIPMPEALTPSGVIKGSALLRKRSDGEGWETDEGPTFIYRPGGRTTGNAFVAVRTRQGLKLLYVLKQRVVIPGPKTTGGKSRLGGIDTAVDVANDELRDELYAAARRVWRKGRKS